ncbi:hypothetical protein [Pseudomonas sp. A-RE-19]|uniref:hypothetical protein n=1 Tax=Pseudomonas sp. A-RE-19 TaxID=2832401 RepID=UPI001CC009FF|nr:hypothetical protein [Pseudomonas sp. A-RE-19]
MIELLNVEIAKSGKIMADEACRGVSQYTLRYRYVTGSGLRPDTPKVNGLTRPGGLVCSRHPLTDKL